MDEKINAYLESFVLQILSHPNLVRLSDQEKKDYRQKLKVHLDEIVFDTVIDNLNDQQLLILKDLEMGSSQMQYRLTEFASEIPGLADLLDKRLKQEVELIINNPQSIS